MNMSPGQMQFDGTDPGFSRSVPDSGYAWWYADALSDDGQHGITIIVFIGSVFSPYYAFARRRGAADPMNHCAVNVALYGKRHRWAMTERPRASVTHDGSSLAIGPSRIAWDGHAFTIDVDEVTVPVPSRIRGTVRVRPAAITPTTYMLNPDGNHRWWPIAPCARVEVALDSPGLRWQGDGYLDSNRGDAPLENGFTDWEWSRAAMRDGTAILYEAQLSGGGRTDLALTFDSAGKVREFSPPPLSPLKQTGWRVRRSIRSDGPDAPHVVKTLENAPFYARSIVAGHLLGESVTLMHESLSLDRFRKPIVQAMLPFRMPRARR